MKCIFLFFVICISSFSLLGQGRCELLMVDEKLKGKCENSYFTNFEIDLNAKNLDSNNLFSLLPSRGFATINNKRRVKVRYEVTTRAGFPQVLIKARPGWFTMDSLIIQNNGITFKIDHDPDVPVTLVDLKIIRKAKELLRREKMWHKNDDRDCEDDIEKNCYSLFCALQSASIEFQGEYNHRNAIMQKIRHTIVKMYPDKKWQHRLRDFNNMSETDFIVLSELLNRVENEVVKELETKK